MNVLHKARNSAFVKNVIVVMSGTVVAQIIGFSLTPIISRFFSPSEFGVFGSFNSVATVISAGVTLQYTQAILLPKAGEDAINLFVVSCISTLSAGVLCLLVCLLAPATVNGLLKTDGVWALGLLVLSTIIGGLNQSCQAWSVRAKAFRHTSASQVIRSLGSNGSQVGLGYLKTGATGLVISSVVADLLASANLLRVLIPDLAVLKSSVRMDRMKHLAKEYRDFPMYSASQNVLNALSSGLPVLMLGNHFGILVAGAYAFSIRVIQTPMGVVLGALRQVLFQRAAEVQRQGGKLAPLFIRITTALFALALLPTLVVVKWAPEIFVFIFGPQWGFSGECARWIMLWMLFYFCNLPAVLFARLMRIQRAVFCYDVVLLVLRVSALALGGRYLSALQTIVIFSCVGAVMNGILIVFVGRSLVARERELHST